jgi:RluA family pseudouridine synthase
MAREQAATRRLVRRVGQAEAGRPLVDLLAAWVPGFTGLEVARARVRALIAAGAVHVDGVPRRSPSLGLRAGARVDVRLRLEALRSAPSRSDRPFTLGAAEVLYEDDWLTAIDKPPGLPTHATADPRRPSLVGALQEKLAAAGRGRYVAVHQRLDRDTSGVVLFATDPAANDGLARAFAGRQVEKTYVALALPAGAAAVPAAGARLTVDVPLAVSEDGRVRAGGAGAKPASTEIIVREALPGLLLVEAHPVSGRKHQVRVHLAHAGLPVAGDPLYGVDSPGSRAPRLMLHAAQLVLPHPISGRPLVIASPLPRDFALLLEQARLAPVGHRRRTRR